MEAKNHRNKARRDASVILTVFGSRKKNNEDAGQGVFGFRTWWLSTDVLTYRVLNRHFKHRYPVSCYMRPDFLYNYIALSPSKETVEEVFESTFPSLVGVNISYHVPPDLARVIQQQIAEYRNIPAPRLQAVIRELSDEIKFNPELRSRSKIVKYFSSKMKQG